MFAVLNLGERLDYDDNGIKALDEQDYWGFPLTEGYFGNLNHPTPVVAGKMSDFKDAYEAINHYAAQIEEAQKPEEE